VTLSIKTLSIITLRITTFCHYAECRCAACRDLFIVMLSVVMLSVIMLNVVMESVIMLIVVMLGVIMLGYAGCRYAECRYAECRGAHNTAPPQAYNIIYLACKNKFWNIILNLCLILSKNSKKILNSNQLFLVLRFIMSCTIQGNYRNKVSPRKNGMTLFL